MKIVKLSAQNFKRLRAVEIIPTGEVVELRGRNGEGKSSVLDAIQTACGGAAVAPGMPIRRGETAAEIKLDLTDGLTVTRRFTPSGTTLVIEGTGPDGSRVRYSSPQSVLDKLIGAIAFDPLEFSRAKPVEQLAQLRQLVQLDVDLDQLEVDRSRTYDERTGANRQLSALRAQLTSFPELPPDVPDSPIDVTALTQEVVRAGERNVEREREAHRRRNVAVNADNHRRAASMDRDRIDAIKRQLEELRTTLAVHERSVADHTAEAERVEADLASLPPLPAVVDTAEATAAVRRAQAMNELVGKKRDRANLATQVEDVAKRSEELTQALAGYERRKREAFARARYPVENLRFDETQVLYDGVPFAQASQAEKIRVSVAVAMAANPKLRVLCVRDGSLLDRTSLALLTELVRESDYQLWLEVTDDDAASGVIIEDGTAREASDAVLENLRADSSSADEPSVSPASMLGFGDDR